MNPADLVTLIDKGGAVAVLVVAVLALAWMVRWLLTLLLASKDATIARLIEERDAWRSVALSTLRLGERSASVAEQKVGLV